MTIYGSISNRLQFLCLIRYKPPRCGYRKWKDRPDVGHREIVNEVRQRQVEELNLHLHYRQCMIMWQYDKILMLESCLRNLNGQVAKNEEDKVLIQWQMERINYLESHILEMDIAAAKREEEVRAKEALGLKGVVELDLFH